MPLTGLLLSGHRRKGIGTMGRPRAFTLEQELVVCEEYERLERAKPIADKYGVNLQTIYRVLKKHGIPRTHRHKKPKASGIGSGHKGIDANAVCDMYKSGNSVTSIAGKFDCSASTVYYHLEKAGLYKVGERKDKLDELMPKIVELHEQGMSDYKIADILGIGRYAVNKRLRKMGIRRGKGSSAPRTAVCPRCGKTFKTNVHNQMFCSKKCERVTSWNRRNDAKRVNTDGDMEDIPLREVWERDKGRCYICGRETDWDDYRIVNGWRVTGPRYPTRDHVIALHNGGSHTWDNVRLACFECNCNKSDKGQTRLAIA